MIIKYEKVKVSTNEGNHMRRKDREITDLNPSSTTDPLRLGWQTDVEGRFAKFLDLPQSDDATIFS